MERGNEVVAVPATRVVGIGALATYVQRTNREILYKNQKTEAGNFVRVLHIDIPAGRAGKLSGCTNILSAKLGKS